MPKTFLCSQNFFRPCQPSLPCRRGAWGCTPNPEPRHERRAFSPRYPAFHANSGYLLFFISELSSVSPPRTPSMSSIVRSLCQRFPLLPLCLVGLCVCVQECQEEGRSAWSASSAHLGRRKCLLEMEVDIEHIARDGRTCLQNSRRENVCCTNVVSGCIRYQQQEHQHQ